MARHKLKSTALKSLPVGRHHDGAGLCLRKHTQLSGSWKCRVQVSGKITEHSVGTWPHIGLAAARELSEAHRAAMKSGASISRATQAPSTNFLAAAERYWTDRIAPTMKSDKARAQWIQTIRNHCRSIAHLPISDLNQDQVYRVLNAVWDRPALSKRLKQRISAIVQWAIATGQRSDSDPVAPAVLLLPVQAHKTTGQASMPYKDLPAFWNRLKPMQTHASIGLQVLILSCLRSNEVRMATWDEIDLEGGVWRLSAERMKANRGHEVPLSTQLTQILKLQRLLHSGKDAFPGPLGRPLSENAFGVVLKRLNAPFTAHGFRSTARTWMLEQTEYERDVAEAMLAHKLGSSATESAYIRGTLFEHRVKAMQDWADYDSSASR